MKVLAIGDPHGDLDKIRTIPLKGVDIILLTGDLGKADLARKRFFENIEREKKGLLKLEGDAKFARQMHMQIHDSTIKLLDYLSKHAEVYAIQGNVGIPSKPEVKEYEEKHGIKLPVTRKVVDRMKHVYVVKNGVRNIEGIRVGFLEYFLDTSWVKEFKPSDYAEKMKKARKDTDKAKRILKRFGKLDILVCHQPPYGVLDKVNFPGAPKHWQGKHAGSKTILDYARKYQPKYIFCGHIHEGEGHAKIGKTEVFNLGVAGWKVVELEN